MNDPDRVISAIAQALAIRETASQPPSAALSTHLRSWHFLLVLDNFEQIITAAPQLADLLAAAPRLKMLTTSRTSLHITVEHTYAVPPLALPDAARLPSLDQLARVAAVELFVQRAQAVTSFALEAANAADVAGICWQLDGLPLAIELAAARSKLLTPAALLARLNNRLSLLTSGERDRPDRQQILRGTIDWSYDLLNPAERLLFARLGVFTGGWSLEAAEVVTALNVQTSERSNVLDALSALVHHSLVHRIEGLDGQPRFTILETIREYALERLAASGEADSIRRQHADYYLQFVTQLHPGILGNGRRFWLRHLDAECDNLRSALAYALDRGDAASAMRLARVMMWFWGRHGLLSEGRERLAAVLSLAPGDDLPQRLIHAQALVGAGGLDVQQGDNRSAQSHFQAALVIFQELGERHSSATTLLELGQIAFRQQYYESARSLLDQSLAIFTELGDQRGMGEVRSIRGLIAWSQGQYDQAVALLNESLAIARQSATYSGVAHNWDISGILGVLGMIAWSRGDYEQSRSLHQEGLQIDERLGNRWGRSHALINLGIVAWLRGEYSAAAEFHAQSLELAREMQATLLIAWSLRNLGTDLWSLGDYARATALHLESLPLYNLLPDRWGIAECLEGLAWAASSEAQAAAASPRDAVELMTRVARFLGAAGAMRQTINGQMPPGYRATFDRVVADLQRQLGADAFATAWNAGWACRSIRQSRKR